MSRLVARREWFGGFLYSPVDSTIAEFDIPGLASALEETPDVVMLPYAGTVARPPSPVRVNLDLTYRCNRQCVYCHSNSGAQTPAAIAAELSPAEWCEVVSAVAALGAFEVTFTGGEPLLKAGLFDILACAGTQQNLHSTLITNGTRVTRDTAQRLRECGVSRVGLSIDGFERVMAAHRWKQGFRDALQALDNLLEAGVPVVVISVISRENWREIHEFAAFLEGRGVTLHNTSALCDIGRARDGWLGLGLAELEVLSKEMCELAGSMAGRGYFLTFNSAVLALGDRPRRVPIYIFEDAVPGWKCVVTPNGRVLYDRVWGDTCWIGDVRRAPLHRIWAESEDARLEHLARIHRWHGTGNLARLYYRVGGAEQGSWRWLSSFEGYAIAEPRAPE